MIDKADLNNIYQNIYEILDEVRKRPGLFACNYKHKKSFNALTAFIQGLGFAEIDEGNPSFWAFSRWITGRVDRMSKTLPWYWMSDKWGDEEAFDRFFELLDEYRVCRLVNLCQASSKEYKPTFYYMRANDEIVRPELPLELYIAQFKPSQVYCLLEIYPARQEEYFPYQNSLEEVKQLANSRWKVSNNEWFILTKNG